MKLIVKTNPNLIDNALDYKDATVTQSTRNNVVTMSQFNTPLGQPQVREPRQPQVRQPLTRR